MCGDEREVLRFGGGKSKPVAAWSSRAVSGPQGRPQRIVEVGPGHVGFRPRSQLCDCIGHGCCSCKSETAQQEKSQLVDRFFGRRRRTRRAGSTQKQLARFWFSKRQTRKASGRIVQEEEEVQSFGEARQRPWGSAERADRSCARSCSEKQRPTSGTAGITADADHEGWAKQKSWIKAEEGKKLQFKQWYRPGVRQLRFRQGFEESSKGPQSGREELPEGRACEAVCEKTGEGSGCGGPSIQNSGCKSQDQLWEAAKLAALPLSGVPDLGMVVEGGTGKGCVAGSVNPPGNSSMCPGRGLAGGVVAHPLPGAPDVWRGSKFPSTCHFLPQEHARACQDNRKSEAKGRRKGRSRSERQGEGWQERPRQAQAQGQQGELCRHLRPQPEVETTDEPVKPGKSCSVLDSLNASWGSFGRFLKLLNTSKQFKRSGPRTPPKPCREDHLFPSLLVIPESNGKPRGARSRARRRDRDEAWGYAETIWALFTFLEGGSPFRASDQQSLLRQAAQARWTSLHSTYAGFLHREIHRYVRLQSAQEPLSRGILKLAELVKVVKNSSYSSNPSVEKMSNVAKDVKPDRMSLPTVAGIVNPCDYLKGEHLKAFKNMSADVPHNQVPINPTKGCFKVQAEDKSAVFRKLLDSGVAALIPEDMGVRDIDGNLITGGLFAVDHKPDSDRIILDRRPFNELERRLVWARLPHGSLLTQLIVPKGFSVRGSGDDLSNYFYLLKHNTDWLPRNVVGTSFDGEGYEAYGGEKGKSIF